MRWITTAAVLALGAVAAFAQDEPDAVYFQRVFPSFQTEQEAASALSAPSPDREALLRAGNYYWMLGTSEGLDAERKRAYCRKAIDALETLWRKDRRDNEVCLSLGYAYTGLAGATPLSQLEAVLAGINRAQNLFGMVVARLPRNMDSRLARTLINMNLTPQNGRPDALVLEDADVFFAGYTGMSTQMQAHPYYYMAAMEMWLARALVYHDQGKRALAQAAYARIDATVLATHFRNLLAPLQRVYGR